MGQIDTVVLYFATFEMVQMQILSASALSLVVLGVSAVFFALYLMFNKRDLGWQLLKDYFRTSTTLLFFGYGFTPVIRTLTTSISTDTIYATAFLLFLLSLVFHDYGMDAPIVSSAFSLNLCLASSVCLISRVDGDTTAFHLFALALCAFCFWPSLRQYLTNKWMRFPLWFIGFIAPASICALYKISVHLTIIHLLVHAIIVLACPMLLVRMQYLKR
jgi:phosphatidylinositol glycan class C protein